MYKKWMAVVAVGVLGAGLAAAKARPVTGNGDYVTREVPDLAAFTALSVQGQIEVNVAQTAVEEAPAVSVSGPENLVDLVNISSQDGVLHIAYKEPLEVLGDDHVQVQVAAPALQRMEVQESGEINAAEQLDLEELDIRVNGKGEVDLDGVRARAVRINAQGDGEVDIHSLICETLQVETAQTASLDVQRLECDSISVKAANRSEVSLSGLSAGTAAVESQHSAKAELKGAVSSAVLTARGRSALDAGSLRADNADVMAEKSAHIHVRVSDTLNAQTSGRGVVEYKGWPRQINRGGSGAVRQDR